MDLTDAVTNSDSALPGYNESLDAVNALANEIPALRDAFSDIKDSAAVTDFSSTIDVIDFVELVRYFYVSPLTFNL